MFDYQELLNVLPMDQLAAQVGESREDVESAVRNALPALLMGMGANAQDPSGEASLANALQSHSPSLLQGGVDLSQVDSSDGAKITRNVFGDNEDAVVNQLGGLGGGSGLIQKLMPILAPIVMSWLAGKLMGIDERQGQGTQQPTQTSTGGGILGGILGQILGRGAAGTAPQIQQPQQAEPQFRQPQPQTGDTPSMPFPDASSRQPQQDQPGGGLGDVFGGGLGSILGDLLGGGRR